MNPAQYRKRRQNEALAKERAKKTLAEKLGRETSGEEIKDIRKKGFWRKIKEK